MLIGIAVLASLLYAGAVQIGTRTSDIAAYGAGRSAVSLVRDLDGVAAALAAYRPLNPAEAHPDQARRVSTALARVAGDIRMADLDDVIPVAAIERFRLLWAAAATRPSDPVLLRSTRDAVREAYVQIGTITVMRGSTPNADRLLAEAETRVPRRLLSPKQFAEIVHLREQALQ